MHKQKKTLLVLDKQMVNSEINQLPEQILKPVQEMGKKTEQAIILQ